MGQGVADKLWAGPSSKIKDHTNTGENMDQRVADRQTMDGRRPCRRTTV